MPVGSRTDQLCSRLYGLQVDSGPPQQPRPASCPLTVARQPPAGFTCARSTLGSKKDRWRRATIMHAAGPLVVETLAVSRPTSVRDCIKVGGG